MPPYRFLLFLIIILQFAAGLTAGEHRGMWVVRYALSAESEAQSVIRTALDLQITDLYVQVYALGQTWYPSAVAPVSPRARTQMDVLAGLVRKANKNGIRVHAWLNVFYIWAGKNPPQNAEHPFNRNRHSILGAAEINSFHPYEWYTKQGIEGYFIDPADQDHLQRIKTLISELMRRYDLAGIHLDYLRYPQRDVSFSLNGRTYFQQLYFVDPLSVVNRQDEYIRENGLNGMHDFYAVYRSFLKENVRRFLEAVRGHLRTINDKAMLTCAVKADPVQAENTYYQDWQSWLKNDLCDELLLMNYTPETPVFLKILSQAAVIKEYKRIQIGLAAHNQSVDSLLEKIAYVQTTDFGGYALFSYNYLKEHPLYLSRLHRAVYVSKNRGKPVP